jgi:putative nucleotidyltransferase with HDIG domain
MNILLSKGATNMSSQFHKWLKNPYYYRYGFFLCVLYNIFSHYLTLALENVYVFYVIATIFLGVGYYNKPKWLLYSLTTIGAFCFYLGIPGQTSYFSFLSIEFTYLLILYISVGLMEHIQKGREDKIALIFALSKTLDSRDTYTSNHSQNVAHYALEIAKKMNLSKIDCEAIYMGGILHDIGKIGIPEAILLKPGKLSEEEYRTIRQHPIIGYNIIKHISEFKDNGVLDIVLSHHERYDGNGYPNNLRGKQIPLAARIMTVADTFDAMTSKRVYSEEMDLKSALEEIRKNKGSQFDPEIADVFLSLFEDQQEKQAIITYMKSFRENTDDFEFNTLITNDHKGW